MIHILKSKDDFKPHIAVCHMDFNSGSANQENIPLIEKSVASGKKLDSLLLALGETGEDVLQKASYNNQRSQLQAAIKDKVFSPNNEYNYIYIEDFGENTKGTNTAIFEMDNGKSYSVDYKIVNGVVTLEDDMAEVIPQKVYTTADGSGLVLKGADAQDESDQDTNSENSGEAEGDAETVDPDFNEEDIEEDMSDKETKDVELEKIQKAIASAKLEWEAEAQRAELTKSTTEVIKHFDFVEGEDVATLVKGIVADQEVGAVIVKALNAAKEAVAAKEQEMVEIKKAFGDKEQVTEEAAPVVEKGDSNATLEANVKAILEKSKSKK